MWRLSDCRSEATLEAVVSIESLFGNRLRLVTLAMLSAYVPTVSIWGG